LQREASHQQRWGLEPSAGTRGAFGGAHFCLYSHGE